MRFLSPSVTIGLGRFLTLLIALALQHNMTQRSSDPPNISKMKHPSMISIVAIVLRVPAGLSSWGLVGASLSVDVERVVFVQGICGGVSVPLLVVLVKQFNSYKNNNFLE